MRFQFALLLCSGVLLAQTEPEWINRGVQAFRGGQYQEAAGDFQHAVDMNPGNVTARLYLGTAYMQMFIPGSEAPENLANGDRAQAEFERVLQVDAVNKVALASIASLQLNRKKFDDARAMYKRLLSVDPMDASAYYSIAFSTWAQWYPEYAKTRASLGMRPEIPGPLPDASARNALRGRWSNDLDEAMANLHRALEIDPQYDDAMAYLNLFIREKADLAESKDEYVRAITEADEWVRKALETKRAKAGRQPAGRFMAAPPPPPPPPPPGQPGKAGA